MKNSYNLRLLERPTSHSSLINTTAPFGTSCTRHFFLFLQILSSLYLMSIFGQVVPQGCPLLSAKFAQNNLSCVVNFHEFHLFPREEWGGGGR